MRPTADRPVHFGGREDTLRNVLATGEFVASLASLPMLDMVNASSARFEAGVDEAEALGVTMEPSDRFSPHRVADSPASLEGTVALFGLG